jgi:hypothetical protein
VQGTLKGSNLVNYSVYDGTYASSSDFSSSERDAVQYPNGSLLVYSLGSSMMILILVFELLFAEAIL